MELQFINSLKEDGNMHFKFGDKEEVLENRKKFFYKYSINLSKTLYIKIKYKDEIFILDQKFLKNNSDLSQIEVNTDCIITDIPGIFLYLPFADCIPMAIFDKKNDILAFAHMGWQSVELDLHKKIIKTLKEKYNTNINDVEVILGPSIKKESYVLKNPSQLKFERWQPFLKEVKKEYYEIDLCGYVVDSLKEIGVKNISVDNVDTVKNNNYFSHYRCTYINKQEKEGRFIVGVMMKS